MTAGKSHASLKDIASHVGVSISLVSFVLNGKAREHRVSEEMVRKIEEAAAELNYQPNIFAKSLREGKSRVIGVVLSDISNPFFSAIARCLEDEAENYGYSVLFSSSDENCDRSETLIAHLINRGVDGLIVVPCENSENTVKAVLGTGKPLVLIDRFFPDIQTNFVCLNNREVSRLATAHLLASGYSHPGIIAYETSLQHMKDRIDGYRQAMKDAGKGDMLVECCIKDSEFHSSIHEALKEILARGVDSLLFATNNIATESLMVIKEMGIDIPGKLGIIGFDGGSAFDLFHVPISYVQQPVPLMARKAVEIIMDEILNGDKPVSQVEVPGTLVIKESTNKQ